jgi:hypothetical protein
MKTKRARCFIKEKEIIGLIYVLIGICKLPKYTDCSEGCEGCSFG